MSWRIGLSTILIGLLPALAGAEEISFRNDVMAVLSKAGCNAGACHGNKSGKAGFKLSLRGQDPDVDYLTLTRDTFARRTNPLEPDQSLILLKPTTAIAHEGGMRFARESHEYQILRNWIAAGTPPDSAATPRLTSIAVSPAEQILVDPQKSTQIRVTATFSDGSQKDASTLTVYEQATDLAKISHSGLVSRDRMGETTVVVRFLGMQQPVRLAFLPARPTFAWSNPRPANFIDEQIFAKLKSFRINPSKPCTDSEFVRRVYLDLLGILPTAQEAKSFVTDQSPDKRGRLVDELLNRPEFADFWALKWADLLRLEERALDKKGVSAFHRWIRQSIAENKPLDQFVREMIAARGSTYVNPAANFYRANREPVIRSEATAQLFLGTRLQCAQCHNHPFDRWTQDDYYSWAAVFSRIDYKILENRRRDNNDKHEFIGEQVVYESREGSVKDPRTGKPSPARLLGTSDTNFPDDQSRLDHLAGWLTSPQNPLFAKSQANRIWFNLMGRGIVDPIDDFRPTNPPSHPALLDALAKDFVDHGFDVRYLIRLIMNSQSYALSSEPNDTNLDDEINYSHVLPRRLTAEQLLDAQHQVAGVPTNFNGYPEGIRASQVPGVQSERRRGPKNSAADRFLTIFGRPQRLLTCECERSGETTMNQAFQLISGPEISQLLRNENNRLTSLLASNQLPDQMITELYWTALSRPPTSIELAESVKYLAASKEKRKAMEDIAWALMNAKEFVLRK
ncbi:MAG TPA: DUF1549 and DUF1553 domain-containing protein [Tepidisphaeraceae bacterium]|jgi:hypothetical protein|nr:DUF1549 and DUF1553 domain-containing protein [Tepidisphaeraceae bacterium]